MVPSRTDEEAQGYAHRLYAESLAEFGQVVSLPTSGGWLIARPVGDTGARDVMGPYPLFSCRDWDALGEDIHSLPPDIVSVTLVADPFGDYTESHLRAVFERVVIFKERYVTDLSIPSDARISRHHQKMSAKALRSLSVEVVTDAPALIDEWTTLYANTVKRHRLTGMRAFSRESFECQLSVPGLVMFRASQGPTTVGINLWFVDGPVAYGHLAGIAPSGYALGASYALYWSACQWFESRCRWLDLGGVAGSDAQHGAGLDYFKRGWSTGRRPTYLCGSVLDRGVYEKLVTTTGNARSDYFPAYRTGEFS